MMVFYPLLWTDVHWRWLARRRVIRWLRATVERAARPLVRRAERLLRARLEPAPVPVRYARTRRALSELAATLVLLAVITQAMIDNASVPPSLRVAQPAWAKAVVEYPRLLQGWRMFAPDPPRTDSMIHVDATTAEGKHVDPYNLLASRTPFPAGGVVPAHMNQNQFFTMYSERIGIPSYAAYRQAFHEWLIAYPQRTGRPHDCLLSFEVFLVTDRSPLPGENKPPTAVDRVRFMHYQAPTDGPCKPPEQTPDGGELRARSSS
jgi:hypothetical protein